MIPERLTPREAECQRCAELRAMPPEDLIRFLAPLMTGEHWRLVAQAERIRSIAIRKHEAGHPRA